VIIKKKKKLAPTQRVNFGNRTRYRPEKDDVPVHDRGRSNKSFRPTGLDDYDPEEDGPPSFQSKDGW